MVRAATFALACAPLAAAFPALMEMSERADIAAAIKRAAAQPRQPLFRSGRENTGVDPAPGFDAKEQLVDISAGSGHEFQAPGPNDLRGECPGLNAAANHGFIPRNGILSIAQTVTGLRQAYNMNEDLSLGLAASSVVLSGDYITETWSIGGKYPGTLGLTDPGGLYSLHSRYEGDASPVRGDAYLHQGQVDYFNMPSWEHLWDTGPDYDLDGLAAHNDWVQSESIMNNPYYFTGFFAAIVTPAAHNFIVNFMSNHTAQNPGGYLNRDILSTFYSVTGDSADNFVHNKYQERIPENWYKRPAAVSYSLPAAIADILVNDAMYPGIVRIGGNTGKVNTFAGVNMEDLTGGAFNSATLLEGNNLACFALQAVTASNAELDLDAVKFIESKLSPMLSDLGCPQLAQTYHKGAYSQYPGASYKATGVSK